MGLSFSFFTAWICSLPTSAMLSDGFAFGELSPDQLVGADSLPA